MGIFNFFNNKDTFIEKLNEGVVSNKQISFIKDSKEIFTHGELWGGGFR